MRTRIGWENEAKYGVTRELCLHVRCGANASGSSARELHVISNMCLSGQSGA